MSSSDHSSRVAEALFPRAGPRRQARPRQPAAAGRWRPPSGRALLSGSPASPVPADSRAVDSVVRTADVVASGTGEPTRHHEDQTQPEDHLPVRPIDSASATSNAFAANTTPMITVIVIALVYEDTVIPPLVVLGRGVENEPEPNCAAADVMTATIRNGE